MTDSLSQDGRIAALATPLAKDKLLLCRFDGNEGLGELFEYQVQALSADSDIDFNKLIGRNLSVHLDTADDVGRDFSGVLVEARSLGKHRSLYYYRMTLRPWLWLLSHTSNCRIFSSMAVNDIITKVFQDKGFTDFEDKTSEEYPTLEYCVQYRETDLSFVSRLMEEYGIYYYFEFEKGDGVSPSKHTLVLVDSKGSHPKTPGLPSIPYWPGSGGERRDQQRFEDWSSYRAFQSGRFVLNDYDYEKPGANLLADAEHSGGYAHGTMEIYDYPGDYEDQGAGKTLAKVRLDADQVKDHRRSATGYAPSLKPGYTVTRTSEDGPSSDDVEYLVLHSTHSYGYQTYESSGSASTRNEVYEGTYELVSSDRQFRSPQVTKKTIIQGPQTAKVVGQQGEEIDVDKEGRVLVQFYWDRKKTSSRRVRVGQIWAGRYQRSLFIPRIGDEVIVHYLEGDPDRPMVAGAVYNGENTPPVDLPANKTKSGINTDSSKGHSGRNTFSFEDKTGQEYVHLRAQRDLTVQALNDETRNVGANQSETIGGNITQSVGGDFTINVGGPAGGGHHWLTATQQIVLTVGMSTLTINAQGITLSAPEINFEAIAEINSQAMSINDEAAEMSVSAGDIAIEAGGVEITAAVTVEGAIGWTSAVGPPPVPAPV